MKNEKHFAYRGKQFIVPELSDKDGFTIVPREGVVEVNSFPKDHPVLLVLNKPFDLGEFAIPRRPLSLGVLSPDEQTLFVERGIAPRVLDLPIKFPGSAFCVPREFAQFIPVIQKVADHELALNPLAYDEYYCYMTTEEGWVEAGELQREAPCHVDGFQGARWEPKVRGNHTYTVSDVLPTVYYPQPFETSHLDPAKHDFFWDFNRQVAATNSAHAWRPKEFELTLMDCYSVHRGDAARKRVHRTWLRLSFEVRIFDRLGNAHNPLFNYDWDMVPRDIEALGLVAYDENSDPSLRVFPWQKPNGTPHENSDTKTQPVLKPKGE
jgi:hypothetical protein